MQINLELYRTFAKCAETGSVTEAAKELHLTQPAVSQAVKQLENNLGTPLFIRTARGVTLTGEGEILYRHISGALDAVNGAERYFAQLKKLERGSLKIGASDTLCRHLLLPALKRFHEKYPSVDIQVTNRTSGETAELLRQGRADIGFINMPADDPEDFDIKPISRVRDCFVCGREYFGSFTRPVSPAELTEFPILMLERLSASRRYVDSFFVTQGVELKPQIELGSLDLLTGFAESGLGVAAVIREFLGDAEKNGRLKVIELDPDIPPRQVGMIKKKGVPLSFAGRAFAAELERERMGRGI